MKAAARPALLSRTRLRAASAPPRAGRPPLPTASLRCLGGPRGTDLLNTTPISQMRPRLPAERSTELIPQRTETGPAGVVSVRVQSGCRLPILCCNILGKITGHSNMVPMRCMADNESMGKKKPQNCTGFTFLT